MKKLPFLVVLMGLGAISMFVPMAHAVRISDFATAQTFFLSGMLSLLLTGLIAVASVNHSTRVNARSSLLGLLGAFVFLPAMLAWPLWYLVDDAAFFRLYFEMLSCLTTTGATLFDASANLSDPVNLWRALVGWLGGFLMLLAAVSILVPLNLGGIEVYARPRSTRIAGGTRQIKAADASERLLAFARKLAPIYAAMTIALAFGLFLSGERVFVAVVHAMATLSTSGIRAVGVQGYGTSGLTGEAIVFVFLLIAASRATISALQGRIRPTEVLRDHEFATMTIIVLILPLIMFLRHWSVAPDIAAAGNIRAALLALWGSVFTVLSFLTTTGFESAHWAGARDWSGLHGPGILLMGLAVTGGGIATTAGGVKLLRVYALYRHGAREFRKLAHPSSVGGAAGNERRIRREGAYVAWLFLTLFAITTALALLALTLSGLDFETSLTLAIAAMTTTGPLAGAVLGDAGNYGALNDGALAILSVAMILGRLETLAIVALLSPEFWRS